MAFGFIFSLNSFRVKLLRWKCLLFWHKQSQNKIVSLWTGWVKQWKTNMSISRYHLKSEFLIIRSRGRGWRGYPLIISPEYQKMMMAFKMFLLIQLWPHKVEICFGKRYNVWSQLSVKLFKLFFPNFFTHAQMLSGDDQRLELWLHRIIWTLAALCACVWI